VRVDLDLKDIKYFVDNTGKKYPQALRRALSRAGDTGRAEMSKAIAADTGISSRRIKEQIKIQIVGDAGLQLVIEGKRVPLIEFAARGPEPSRGRGRGVSYRLPGGRGRAEKAFIATMPTGHRGVYQRTGNARSTRRAKGWSGLPIYELFGPSMVEVFKKFLPLGADKARASFVKNLRSELGYWLGKR
jgi:hypothetical protein